MKSVLALLFLLGSTTASAHPLDLGYLKVEEQGSQISVSLELNPMAATRFSSLADPLSNNLEVRKNVDALFISTLGRTDLFRSDTPCRWTSHKAEWISEQTIRVSARADCLRNASGPLRIDLKFLQSAPSTYQVLGKALISGEEHSFLAESKSRIIQIAVTPSSQHGLGEFIKMGVEHIGATPGQWQRNGRFHLPDGLDHILFLLALILCGGGVVRILKTATGFTLGHSVTLALATLGWVQLPGRLVESAIALSIVYVAIEAAILKDSKSQWRIAALFGLVHGFGFATALQDLHLTSSNRLAALVGFNFGVEVGQALIIFAVLPVIVLARIHPQFYRRAVQASASAIGLAGSYWFVVRAFG